MLSNAWNNIQTIKSRVIDQREATFRRLKELYRKGGSSEVLRGIRDYYRHNVADRGYQAKRIDNEHRWSIIESYLDSDSEFLVDLGCADGYFVERASEHGLNVLGIEGNYNRVKRARERFSSNPGVEINALRKYIVDFRGQHRLHV